MEMIQFLGIIILIGLFIACILISVIYKKLYRIIRDIVIKVKPYENMEELVRDIDVTYSPTVLSYLINQEIEPQKDFLATILNLYAKKAINMEKKDGKYLLTEGEKSGQELGLDEKYIYDIIINDQKIDFIKWNQYIRKEYDKYCFSNKVEYDPVIVKIIFALFTIPITIFTYIKLGNALLFCVPIFLLALLISGFLVFIIYCFSSLGLEIVVNSNIFLTDKGKREVKKWMRFKKFIEEYTLIEDKPIEATMVWEKFIPYAMALNINKEYQQREMKLFKQEELYNLKQFIDLNKYGISFRTKLQNQEKNV